VNGIRKEREEIEKVLDKYPADLLAEMSAVIRKTIEAHPPGATCDCPAINALRVLERRP
jgi:hypothetical protein